MKTGLPLVARNPLRAGLAAPSALGAPSSRGAPPSTSGRHPAPLPRSRQRWQEKTANLATLAFGANNQAAGHKLEKTQQGKISREEELRKELEDLNNQEAAGED